MQQLITFPAQNKGHAYFWKLGLNYDHFILLFLLSYILGINGEMDMEKNQYDKPKTRSTRNVICTQTAGLHAQYSPLTWI